MTTTEQVQDTDTPEVQSQDTTQETTQESQETTKVKRIELPEPPDAIRHPSASQPKTIAMGSIFLAKWDEANNVLREFEGIRQAKSESEKILDTSDHPKAVEYRQVKTKTQEVIDHLKKDSEWAKEIERLEALIKEKVDEAKATLKTVRTNAHQEVTGTIVSELDPTQLSQKLTDINSVLLSLKGVLKDEVPELAKWNVISVNTASGEKSSGKRNATDVKRPRLRLAFVDDTPVTPSNGKFPTSTDIAKVLGVKDVGNFNKLMFQACGNASQIPYEEFHFQLNVNGTTHTVRVAGRTGAENATEDEAAA